jgi:phage protein
LTCDLAETYHLFNYKDLSPTKVAVLVFGLGAKSRIYKKMQGIQEIPDYLLLPSIHDRLSEIEYMLVGNNKKEMPTRLVDLVLGREDKSKKKDSCKTYMSVDDFNKSRYGGA